MIGISIFLCVTISSVVFRDRRGILIISIRSYWRTLTRLDLTLLHLPPNHSLISCSRLFGAMMSSFMNNLHVLLLCIYFTLVDSTAAEQRSCALSRNTRIEEKALLTMRRL